jgi:hypothetical protein
MSGKNLPISVNADISNDTIGSTDGGYLNRAYNDRDAAPGCVPTNQSTANDDDITVNVRSRDDKGKMPS